MSNEYTSSTTMTTRFYVSVWDDETQAITHETLYTTLTPEHDNSNIRWGAAPSESTYDVGFGMLGFTAPLTEADAQALNTSVLQRMLIEPVVPDVTATPTAVPALLDDTNADAVTATATAVATTTSTTTTPAADATDFASSATTREVTAPASTLAVAGAAALAWTGWMWKTHRNQP